MESVGLSKSKYVQGVALCRKVLWMDAHMPEWFDESVLDQARLDEGSAVGDLAMGYYGDYVEVPYDKNDYAGMIARTKELLDARTPVICEATFSYDNCLCMVDILRVQPDGSVDLVEVKSSMNTKFEHYHDVCYQYWVLSKCGLKVNSASLMHINPNYVREGELDLQELFVIEDFTGTVSGNMQDEPEAYTKRLKAMIASDEEPEGGVWSRCLEHNCGYRPWCWRDVPNPSVFDLYGVGKKGCKFYSDGIATMQDVLDNPARFNEMQLRQARAIVEDAPDYVDAPAIRSYLDELTFPLYFLDFETIIPAVPLYDGTSPYQQVPTQYSLHYILSEGAEVHHCEYLAPEEGDPRRGLAEQLCSDIPRDVCVVAYNMSFEKRVIEELAGAFPDLADHLMSIHANMKDLLDPFKQGLYYTKAMGGSFSIKSVLPALFPDDPELDYHALEGIHHGGEAMAAFPKLASMPPEERAVVREQLLRYCELDTLAMVKIWQKLREVSGA